MVFFNDRLGEIMVRASLHDLEIIQHAIEFLNRPPPQLTIESKIVETDEEVPGLGLDWNESAKEFIGILTDAQFRRALTTLKQHSGPIILAAPKVLTLSGRQTHIASSDEKGGMTLDTVATVEPDGYSIKTIAIPYDLHD